MDTNHPQSWQASPQWDEQQRWQFEELRKLAEALAKVNARWKFELSMDSAGEADMVVRRPDMDAEEEDLAAVSLWTEWDEREKPTEFALYHFGEGKLAVQSFQTVLETIRKDDEDWTKWKREGGRKPGTKPWWNFWGK
jgi:hypothetical protein